MTPSRSARLLFVEVESQPLGGRVHLDLERSCTVLIGRNASGKSLTIETLVAAFFNASVRAPRSLSDGSEDPIAFKCQIEIGEKVYEYEYSMVPLPIELDDDLGGGETEGVEWRESCRLEGQDSSLWQVDSGEATSGLDPELKLALPRESGLLHTSYKGLPDAIASHVEAVRGVLRGFFLVVPEVPRSADGSKQRLFLRREPSKKERRGLGSRDRLLDLTSGILRMFEVRKDDFSRFSEVCKRVLGIELEVIIYRKEKQTKVDDDVAEVKVGEDNVGLASDGTLRALDILFCLEVASPGHLLMVEEPELFVHPGLLARVLNEVETWSSSGQVLVSTHSPQVLDWRLNSPQSVRVVSRQNGKTNVCRVQDDEMRHVVEYLQDEGELSDYFFFSHADVEAEEALGG